MSVLVFSLADAVNLALSAMLGEALPTLQQHLGNWNMRRRIKSACHKAVAHDEILGSAVKKYILPVVGSDKFVSLLGPASSAEPSLSEKEQAQFRDAVNFHQLSNDQRERLVTVLRDTVIDVVGKALPTAQRLVWHDLRQSEAKILGNTDLILRGLSLRVRRPEPQPTAGRVEDRPIQFFQAQTCPVDYVSLDFSWSGPRERKPDASLHATIPQVEKTPLVQLRDWALDASPTRCPVFVLAGEGGMGSVR